MLHERFAQSRRERPTAAGVLSRMPAQNMVESWSRPRETNSKARQVRHRPRPDCRSNALESSAHAIRRMRHPGRADIHFATDGVTPSGRDEIPGVGDLIPVGSSRFPTGRDPVPDGTNSVPAGSGYIPPEWRGFRPEGRGFRVEGRSFHPESFVFRPEGTRPTAEESHNCLEMNWLCLAPPWMRHFHV